MFLLIFESIGTSELIMIGIVALIFLGPRKLPEIARKMGKIMADFRNTTNDFKQTWEREVNFEEEAKTIRDLNAEPTPQTPPPPSIQAGISAPEIKEIDATTFNDISASSDNDKAAETEEKPVLADVSSDTSLTDKKDWL